MSRAINVNATAAEVEAQCRKKGAAISAIEALASGGTRVVLCNIDGANMMNAAFGRKVITGAVTRAPTRMMR